MRAGRFPIYGLMSKTDLQEHYNGDYDNAEFTVANSTTDYDVQDNQDNTFGGTNSNVGATVYKAEVRTDQTIGVKFNSASNDEISLTSGDSPLVFEDRIRNIYISNNGGSTANVKILLK